MYDTEIKGIHRDNKKKYSSVIIETLSTMNRYKINITLSDGDQVQAKSVGNNQDEALARLWQTEQFIKFVADRDIKSLKIDFDGIVQPVNPDNYIVQESEKPNHYVVTDKINNVVAVFEKGRYNETAKITPLYDFPQEPVGTATILREIGEYLATYRKDLL